MLKIQRVLQNSFALVAVFLVACSSPQDISNKDVAIGILGDANSVDAISYEGSSDEGTGDHVKIYRAIEQNDLVVLHSVRKTQGVDMVAFDVFSFKEGSVEKRWIGRQPWVEDTVSGRSMVDGAVNITDYNKTEDNALVVSRFIEDVLVNGKAEMLSQYISEDYLQHNPNVGDGRSGLISFVVGLDQQGISFGYTKTYNLIAEGNFVFALSEGDFGGTPTFFYDLFRVEDGIIVEHWDVVQPIDAAGN